MSIRTAALDSLKAELAGLKLVKIDVEGAELLVLRGAKDILQLYRPYLIVEVTDAFLTDMDGTAATLFAHLHAADYDAYHTNAQALTKVEGSPVQQANILFVHRSRVSPALIPRG